MSGTNGTFANFRLGMLRGTLRDIFLNNFHHALLDIITGPFALDQLLDIRLPRPVCHNGAIYWLFGEVKGKGVLDESLLPLRKKLVRLQAQRRLRHLADRVVDVIGGGSFSRPFHTSYCEADFLCLDLIIQVCEILPL